MRTIAIVNQKGGCGKTTTAINLAATLARRGRSTLLVDMDPQGHCALGLGVPEARIDYSIGDALVAEHDRTLDPQRMLWEVSRNLDLAPSTTRLAAAEAPGGGLHERPDRDRRLASLLAMLAPRYDVCLIDCPPTIGLLTFNALRAAREAVIPVETGFFALRGAEKQWSTIQRLIDRLDRPMRCYLLPTLFDPDSANSQRMLAALRRQYRSPLVPHIIREHEALRAAVGFGQPVIEYDPESEAQRDFELLADWLEEVKAPPAAEIEITRDVSIPSMRVIDAEGEQHGDGAEDGPGGFSGHRAAHDVTAVRHRPLSVSARGVHHPPAGSRAAELVQRVRDLAMRSAGPADQPVAAAEAGAMRNDAGPATPAKTTDARGETAPTATMEPDSSPAAVKSPLILKVNTPPRDERMRHLYGVRQISRGALFVQPAPPHATGREPTPTPPMAIAGDFNGWSTTRHRMTHNREASVYQAIIDLPPGRYQYRLVAGGRWYADPYNEHQQENAYGEPNSVLVVREGQVSP